MLRIALVLLLLLPFSSVIGDLPPQHLTGNVWLDFTGEGLYVRVDRAGSGPADGTLDDEYFLMTETMNRPAETIEIANGAVIVRKRSLVVIDKQTRERYFLALADDVPPSSDVSDSASASDRLSHRGIDVMVSGYGIHYTPLAATREELLKEARERSVETNLLCDAGGTCGSNGCSVSCGEDRSCSVSCASGYAACCICQGPNKRMPSCTCVQCTN